MTPITREGIIGNAKRYLSALNLELKLFADLQNLPHDVKATLLLEQCEHFLEMVTEDFSEKANIDACATILELAYILLDSEHRPIQEVGGKCEAMSMQLRLLLEIRE